MFTGLSAFPITPADPDGNLITDDFAAILSRLTAAGVNSIGVLGSTGTYPYLDRDQRRAAIALARNAAGDTPILAGIGALRTSDAIAFAHDAAAAGADGLLLSAMSYTPLSEDEVFTHFTTVADATDLPLCIYDNPGTTHFNFSRDLLVRLAAHPRITACKLPPSADYAGDIAWLRARTPDDFAIGYSADWVMADAMAAGADVFFTAVGGILPDQAMAVVAAAQAGSPDASAPLAPFWDLIKAHGGLRVSYAIANRFGLTTAQPPLPIQPLSDIAALDAALAQIGQP